MKKILSQNLFLITILFFIRSSLFSMDQETARQTALNWAQQEIPKLVISEESRMRGKLNKKEQLLVMRHISDIKISKTRYCGYLLNLSGQDLDLQDLFLVLNFLRSKIVPGGNGETIEVAKVITAIILSENNLSSFNSAIFMGFDYLELVDLRGNPLPKQFFYYARCIDRPLYLFEKSDKPWTDFFEDLFDKYGQWEE